MPKNLNSVLETLIIERPAINRRGGGRNSCILSTRVAIEVLVHFGFEASALTVHVVVGNPAFARLKEDPDTPTDPDAHTRLCEGCGARWIKIGRRAPSPDGWDHHLVAIVRGSQLFDLSIGQASRAGTDFKVDPELIQCVEGFQKGRSELPHTVSRGCYLEYHALPDVTSYQQTRAWLDYQGLVERVIKAVP